MLKDYKEITGKTNIQMEHELGLSAGAISQYIQLLDTNYSSVNEMRRLTNYGKFNFYKCINELYSYLTRTKDIPIKIEHKRKIKIIIARLNKLEGDGI